MGICTSRLAEGLNHTFFPTGTWGLVVARMAELCLLLSLAIYGWICMESQFFGHKTGNPFKIFAKYQIVLFEQTRVSEFINSVNHERMQHCISNENIQQMKSRAAAELSSERKIH